MPTYRATSQNPTTNLAAQPTGNLNASLLDSMWQTLWNVLNDSSNGFVVLATDTGTVNNYVVTNLSPALAYRQGMFQMFLTANVNTGASQINVDGLGNIAITTNAGAALSGGELSATAPNVLIYDGTKFRIFFPVFGGPFVIGDTVTQTNYPPTGIIVPRYKAHPDQIWTYGTFDDHFDTPSSGTPNVKWVQTLTSGTVNPVYTQAGSKICFGGTSAAASATVYENSATQTLPVQTTHTITLKIQGMAFPFYVSAAQTWGAYIFNLAYGSNAGGIQLFFQYLQGGGGYLLNDLFVYGGAAFGTTLGTFEPPVLPGYLRFVYDSSKNTTVSFSMDGITWMTLIVATGTQTGFSTNTPAQWRMGIQSVYQSPVLLQVDWIKHV